MYHNLANIAQTEFSDTGYRLCYRRSAIPLKLRMFIRGDSHKSMFGSIQTKVGTLTIGNNELLEVPFTVMIMHQTILKLAHSQNISTMETNMCSVRAPFQMILINFDLALGWLLIRFIHTVQSF